MYKTLIKRLIQTRIKFILKTYTPMFFCSEIKKKKRKFMFHQQVPLQVPCVNFTQITTHSL